MKNISLKFCLLCILVLFVVLIPNIKPIFCLNDCVTYFFYTYNQTDNIKNAQITTNGIYDIVSCNASYAQNVKKNLKNVLGESVRIFNTTQDDKQKILSRYQKNIVKSEFIDDIEIIYYYDNSLPKFVYLENQKVNIQIAISKNYINIGYPLILNGF